jgi:hypothetical protein
VPLYTPQACAPPVSRPMKSSPAANRLSVAGSEARFLQRVIELARDPQQLR